MVSFEVESEIILYTWTCTFSFVSTLLWVNYSCFKNISDNLLTFFFYLFSCPASFILSCSFKLGRPVLFVATSGYLETFFAFEVSKYDQLS